MIRTRRQAGNINKKCKGVPRIPLRLLFAVVLVAFAYYTGGFMALQNSISMCDSRIYNDVKEKSGDILANVKYSELYRALLDRYYSSGPNRQSVSEDEALHDALEAMYYLETDGNPVPIKGYPGLYVGGVGKSHFATTRHACLSHTRNNRLSCSF